MSSTSPTTTTTSTAPANHHCRVCGLFHATPPWGPDGHAPTYEICDCCGVEFGYEDHSPASTRSYRAAWESLGRQWARPSQKPPDWRWTDQARHIPPEFT